MADLKEDKIDFSKLEKELSAAVESDAHYWRENDAKMRAVEQRVESYEQFRDMVAASHIKPLDKGDKNGILSGTAGKRNQPWNPYSSKGDKKYVTGAENNQQQNMDAAALPKNSNDFTKQWRKLKSNEDKYSFLISIGGDHLVKIFHAEISYGLLGEILTALHESLNPADCYEVIHILMRLTQANRFDLSLDFLSKKEKDQCSALITYIDGAINATTECEDNQSEGTVDSTDSVDRLEGATNDANIDTASSGSTEDNNDNSSNSKMHEERRAPPSKEELMVTKETVEHLKKLYKILPLGG